MIIQTERLVLRPFKADDINWYCSLAKQEEVRKYLMGLYAEDVEKIKWDIEIFSKGDFKNDFYYVIEDIRTNQVMGIVIVTRMTEKMLDVSYFLFKEYRKNGYMYEALKAIIAEISKTNPQYYFRLIVDENNIDSLSLAKKFDVQIVKKTGKFICCIY